MAQRIEFTVRKIDAIAAPASGRDEYKDTQEQGLYLRVTPNGVKTFSFVGRAKGLAPCRATDARQIPPGQARRGKEPGS